MSSKRGHLARTLSALCLSLLILICSNATAYAALHDYRNDGVPTPVTATPESTLTALTRELGWAGITTARPDLPGQSFQVSSRGVAGDPLRAVISMVGLATEYTWLTLLERQGFTSGLWHGREAIIAHAGDTTAHGRGIIAWRCGPFVLAAEDTAGQGREAAAAEALHRVAERCGLCGSGATLVLPVRTADTLPARPWRALVGQAQAAQNYYDHNAYGRVDLAFTFLSAQEREEEGLAAGWHAIAPSLDVFAEPTALAEAAIRAACAQMRARETIYVERVLVILAGEGRKTGAAQRWFAARTNWWPRERYIEVRQGKEVVRVYVPNVVIMLESDPLGTWVHELGHTLPAQTCEGDTARITDRYQERGREPYDDIGPWDLMARGSHWGNPSGCMPTHMSAHTKVEANWLHTVVAEAGTLYTLEAIENLPMGATVLRLADPRDGTGRSHYLLEARDAEDPFGAPESGVLIYHVRYMDGIVQVLPLVPEMSGCARWSSVGHVRPTLHGVADANGAHTYTLPGGVCVRLVAESFQPYRATVWVEVLSRRTVAR